MSLDSTQRSEACDALESTEFDLLIIGGGITGAGIALDAASRGLKTALVEMQDFGAGTSSRSTKLIHGGLRYLKQMEFRLVREVGRERSILHRNAPHIVIPEKMLLPAMKGGNYGRFGMWLGLWIYDRLAGVRKDERRRMLSTARTLKEEPLLRKEGLNGSCLYSEYRTDDARLVIEVLKTADRQGASCLNYCKAESLVYDGGVVCGAAVRDVLSGRSFSIRAREVVNAAGPWVDEVRKLDNSLTGKRLHHTKGVHFVVDHKRLPVRHSIYFDISDGRMMFVIPRGPWTYFGTTDTNYEGDLAHPRVNAADAKYLLDAVNHMFPGVRLEIEDVRSSWAGIRPLIHEDGKSPSELSRKDEIFYSDTGLVTIAGGKLTGFRKMAERVVDVVVKRLVEKGRLQGFEACRTDKIVLVGGEIKGPEGLKTLIKELVRAHDLEAQEVEWLVGLYGDEARQVLELAPDGTLAGITSGALAWSVKQEASCTLDDFFTRRTALLYFGRPWIAAVRIQVQAELEKMMGAGFLADPGDKFAQAYAEAIDFR